MHFNEMLQSVTDFLMLHPEKTVLMEVSKEYTSLKNTRTFEKTFISYKNHSDYQSFWWSHSYLPTLGQARGKIVLLKRFSKSFAVSGSINVTNWQDNTEFNLADSRHVKIHAQNDYKVKVSTNADKWQSIKTNINTAAKHTNVLYLNFTSGYTPILGIPNIRKVSGSINPKLINYFSNQSKNKKTHGVIISDFTTQSLIKSELQ
ncbi:MAG: 1-phosphatidylinositol phosphodiesterase [Candidatus Celerinatantimonas neptuna]|nr:MAG: 1-phosphatidylinositol phosphodiesterase [Candidatus Celerinatantimonas neptuna]